MDLTTLLLVAIVLLESLVLLTLLAHIRRLNDRLREARREWDMAQGRWEKCQQLVAALVKMD